MGNQESVEAATPPASPERPRKCADVVSVASASTDYSTTDVGSGSQSLEVKDEDDPHAPVRTSLSTAAADVAAAAAPVAAIVTEQFENLAELMRGEPAEAVSATAEIRNNLSSYISLDAVRDMFGSAGVGDEAGTSAQSEPKEENQERPDFGSYVSMGYDGIRKLFSGPLFPDDAVAGNQRDTLEGNSPDKTGEGRLPDEAEHALSADEGGGSQSSKEKIEGGFHGTELANDDAGGRHSLQEQEEGDGVNASPVVNPAYEKHETPAQHASDMNVIVEHQPEQVEVELVGENDSRRGQTDQVAEHPKTTEAVPEKHASKEQAVAPASVNVSASQKKSSNGDEHDVGAKTKQSPVAAAARPVTHNAKKAPEVPLRAASVRLNRVTSDKTAGRGTIQHSMTHGPQNVNKPAKTVQPRSSTKS